MLLGCLESSKSLAVTALDVAVSGTKERFRLCKISFFMSYWLKSIQQSIYNEHINFVIVIIKRVVSVKNKRNG